ncbi:MAG: hypothetical protein J6N45_07550 [Alphaproteobacteria bacterium]|nr:hypothetical protein [Alphaproteobacteria bacterium]
MAGKKAKQSTPTADYTALNEQKLREQEEADKYRREQAARRNNKSSSGKSVLSWSGRK